MWHRCNLAAKESGLKCTCVSNDNFMVWVSWGGRHHWMSMFTVWPSHAKWLSEQSNESASNFALSLYIPPRNYLGDSEGQSYGQLVIGSFITTMCLLMHHISCRVFWQNIKSPSWLSPPIAQIWCPGTFGFFKTNTTFEREEISDHQWDSGKYDGAADGNWETVWGPKVPTLKGTEASLSCVQCFLHLISSIQ